jgi:hypothetical protein
VRAPGNGEVSLSALGHAQGDDRPSGGWKAWRACDDPEEPFHAACIAGVVGRPSAGLSSSRRKTLLHRARQEHYCFSRVRTITLTAWTRVPNHGWKPMSQCMSLY